MEEHHSTSNKGRENDFQEENISVVYDSDDSSTGSGCAESRNFSPSGPGKIKRKSILASKCVNETELQDLRLKINSRERRRMHDLNSALDGLREVMPYAHGPSVRKLSKIATLLLARNYILMLNSSLEEMKKLVSDVYKAHPVNPIPHTTCVQTSPTVTPHALHYPTAHHISPRIHEKPKDIVQTTSSITSPVVAHDQHMMYSGWRVPCACNQCSLAQTRGLFPPASLHHGFLGKEHMESSAYRK